MIVPTQKENVRDVLWNLAQGVREAIRDDSGPREESIALAFIVEKLIDKAEAALTASRGGNNART